MKAAAVPYLWRALGRRMRLLLTLLFLAPARSACPTLQYSNYQYLTTAQLAQYNLPDCTTACSAGFYGDFCQAAPAVPPPGPWNQAGYFLAGPPIQRTLTSLPVSTLSQAQFSPENLIWALRNPRYPGTLVRVSYAAGTITTVLSPPAGTTLDALVVRNGVAYLARGQSGVYDVITSDQQRVMGITSQALLMEVFVDKGTVTVFLVDTGYRVVACYPNGCVIWDNTRFNGATSILCGIDCPGSVYVTQGTALYKLTGTSAATHAQDTSNIFCAAVDRALNVLVYKSAAGLVQVNLGTRQASSLLSLPNTLPCSMDISDGYTQIMVMQGSTTTLNALQEACGYARTSPAIQANSSGLCFPCPPPPDNAFIVVGSATCEWQCVQGYAQSGSLCVALFVPPCPPYYFQGSGICEPAAQPWAPAGRYLSGVSVSTSSAWSVGSSPPYLVATAGAVTYLAVSGAFYSYPGLLSSPNIMTLVVPSTGTVCSTSTNNAYYLLRSQNGTLITAFTSLATQTNCLWSLSPSGTRLTQTATWTLGAPVCSAALGQGVAYVIFCGQHYIAQVSSGISPLAGGLKAGYSDGALLASAFNSPSGLAVFSGRVYVADTMNCAIREVDVTRGEVRTVAGTGVCQRVDGAVSGLAYPTNLTSSAYDGFLLFYDQYPTEKNPTARQFHAPTGIVKTIAVPPLLGASSSLNYIAGLPDRVLAGRSNIFYQITASSLPCPAGYSALPGNAPTASACLPCPDGYYSGTSCQMCSAPSCGTGQALVPCQLDRDAYCTNCSNKPLGTVYTGPSPIPANASGGGGDCPWAYVKPCPPGYYLSGTLCAACPEWSATNQAGATAISQCSCLAGGRGAAGSCVIASPFTAHPAVCGPLNDCPAYTEPTFPFPLLSSCQYVGRDSPLYVCPCPGGEFIQQIHPKVCQRCPDGLYSPYGRGCRNCPFMTEPSLDQSACRCARGTWDKEPIGQPDCMCGPGASLGVGGCNVCPANTYSALTVPAVQGATLDCLACPAGTYSLPGASACTACAFGQYRTGGDLVCQNCSAGSYAPDPTRALCNGCVESCGGMKEAPCPTDASLLVCSICDMPRPNSVLQGNDCASRCQEGFYEWDYVCTPCTTYSSTTCPAGSIVTPCSLYADTACTPCTNDTMPLNFAEWDYAPAAPNGPNTKCAWKCRNGYTARSSPLPAIVKRWECVAEGAWSVWDLFTV